MQLETGLTMVMLAAILLVGISRAVLRVASHNYFAILDILLGRWPLRGVIIQCLVPIAWGTAIGLLLPQQGEAVAWYGIGLGGMLLVWPAFLNPSQLREAFKDRHFEVYCVLLMFVASYANLGKFGVHVADIAKQVFAGNAIGQNVATTIANFVAGVGLRHCYGAITHGAEKRSAQAEAN